MMKDYLFAIIPIFVAIDIIGIIPVYLTLTDGIPAQPKARVLQQSVLTAFLVSLTFLAVGKIIFSFLGITMSDFKIAGGIILFAIAINDLIFSTQERKSNEVRDETTEIEIQHNPTIGIVPIGIPLIVGPALLTTILISIDTYGIFPTISSVVINLLIVYTALHYSPSILRLTGRSGAKGLAKVVTLLLAAIGVMMVRVGITEIIRS
jgi:multiple antibiotic resistance protein